MLKVNGEQHDFHNGMTVEELIQEKGILSARVAVERNGEIVPKGEYKTTILTEADTLEIVSFVGGG